MECIVSTIGSRMRVKEVQIQIQKGKNKNTKSTQTYRTWTGVKKGGVGDAIKTET